MSNSVQAALEAGAQANPDNTLERIREAVQAASSVTRPRQLYKAFCRARVIAFQEAFSGKIFYRYLRRAIDDHPKGVVVLAAAPDGVFVGASKCHNSDLHAGRWNKYVAKWKALQRMCPGRFTELSQLELIHDAEDVTLFRLFEVGYHFPGSCNEMVIRMLPPAARARPKPHKAQRSASTSPF